MSSSTQNIDDLQVMITGNTAVITDSAGEDVTLQGHTINELRHFIVLHASREAAKRGGQVRLVSVESNGVVKLLVDAVGDLTHEDVPNEHTDLVGDLPEEIRVLRETSRQTARRPSEPAPITRADIPLPVTNPVTNPAPEPEPLVVDRPSLLAVSEPPPRPRTGWQAVAARIGIPVQPSTHEREVRENVRLVSRHWPGPRRVAVVNGKGGVGKTMTTAMLAAVLARHGGAGVLAWDNNDTRGTLGWRTEQGSHTATVQDLIAAISEVAGSARASDISRFVHHQTEDKYEVLRSDPAVLAARQRISNEDFDALHDIACRFFRVVIFDSGNDESADRWLRMIDHTDQLVVPTLVAGESAESAALLLEELADRDERSAQLARNAIVVVSLSEPGMNRLEAARLVEGFSRLARSVVTIPYDSALKSGPLRWERLRSVTQDAWIAAAAAVTVGFDATQRS